VWLGFWLITWLLNEWITRRTEWRTRFGRELDAPAGKRHPLELHSYEVLAAQALTVCLYGVALWSLQWPLFIRRWPHWLGFSSATSIGFLKLSNSKIMEMLLGLTPFLIAMLISWCPRWRLFSARRRMRYSLWKYLDFEARLTWLPMAAWLAMSVVSDLADMLPRGYTAWLMEPGMSIAVSLLAMGLLAMIGLPILMTRYWQCSPMPEGELKDRLLRLLDRSGVKVRKIMVWGSKDTGMLNACVVGPWARFRYVLISPALADELGMDETEAVLAHELGHARHGHLTLLFIMLLCLSAMLDPLAQLLPVSWRHSPAIEAGAIFLFIVLYIRGFFGAIMRECEREADLASAELVGSPIPIVAALEKLALRSGNIRNVYSWHHGSIAGRVASVLQLSSDPAGSARVHAQIRRVRILFAVLAALAIGAQFLMH
jgi:Zn-dependent protease with chaperone function